jgi:4-hydroxy-3-polyprenylbenzoate decarboxylase
MRGLLARAKVMTVGEPMDPRLEITRFIGSWIRRYGEEPTFLFTRIRGYPGSRVLMNVFKRPLLLAGLGLPENDFLHVAASRLECAGGEVIRAASRATASLAGMHALPVLTHQPGDAGPYLTSFVGCLVNPQTGLRNLGFYRVRVVDNGTGVIFIDPRTDAHRILQAAWTAGAAEVPMTLFTGGPVSAFVAGAAALPFEWDSYLAASRLGGKPIEIDQGEYPPAPADAEIVLHARVLRERADEAPFGEFKGYYCEATRSPILRIDAAWQRPDAYYLGLFCGKESGLELMSLPNEILMYAHLRARGLPVSAVRYPLSAFGEFLTLIEAPFDAAREVLDLAMTFDRRTKMVVVGPDLRYPTKRLSVFDFDATAPVYVKRQAEHGRRIGIALQPTSKFHWTEY